jgi:hypothetical protein
MSPISARSRSCDRVDRDGGEQAPRLQETLKVSKQGALNLDGELSLREMTGREVSGVGILVSPEISVTGGVML